MRIIAAFFLILFPTFAFAHGDSLSWEVESGAYTVDIGYEPESFTAGSFIRFDFGLLQDEVQAPYEHVWVRVLRGKETMLATGIEHQNIGPTTLLYAPQQGGEYVLDVSFRNEEGKEIVSAGLPFSVEAQEATTLWPNALVGLAGLLAGVVLGFLYARRK